MGASAAGRQRRRTKINGAFAPRLIDMIASPAFQVLSLSARKILDRLEIELAQHGGTENGNLPCPYDHFQEFGIDRHAIAPAICELEALGFVQVVVTGGGGNAEFRQPNRFRITYRPTDFAAASDEWKRIDTEEDAVARARRARMAGRRTHIKNKTPVGKTHTVKVGETHTVS
jgi:hypothetical protein